MGKAETLCTVKYHNSKNKDDQFAWDQTTTIEELKGLIFKAHLEITSFRLIYCGKETEDMRRVAEYLMVQDPKPFIVMVKLHGGGKRARAATVGHGDLQSKPGDNEAIKEAFSYKVGGFKQWVMKLDDDRLNDFAKIAKAYTSTPEKIAQNAALLVEPIIAVEACFVD